MSVYKPAKSPFFQYDFQIKGRRFHGSTGVETRRAAEEVERRIRRQAALGELDDASQMTLDQAAGRWWDEHGCTLKGDRYLHYLRDAARAHRRDFPSDLWLISEDFTGPMIADGN